MLIGEKTSKKTSKIIKEKNISRLSEKWAAVKRQADYLNLLNEFEKK